MHLRVFCFREVFGSECLLYTHQRANWKLIEESPGRVPGQADTAMGGWIIRHVSLVHSEIEAAQSHEVRHLDVIDCRSMVAIFVGDDVIARLCGIMSAAASRATRVEHGQPVFDQRDFLRG